MLSKQALEAITKAAQEKTLQELTIKKISEFKARKGYEIIQVKFIPRVVRATDPKHRILGCGYFWSETGEKEFCYVLEVPADEAAPLLKDFEKIKGENRRKYRHRIWNKKCTKKIMCPFTNFCSKCPFADHPEDIFPSEAEEHQKLSYEEINEEKVSVPPEAYGSEESIFYNYQRQEMMNAIKSHEDPIFVKFLSLNRQGFELAEIMEKLNLVREDIERFGQKLMKYMDDYIG